MKIRGVMALLDDGKMTSQYKFVRYFFRSFQGKDSHY